MLVNQVASKEPQCPPLVNQMARNEENTQVHRSRCPATYTSIYTYPLDNHMASKVPLCSQPSGRQSTSVSPASQPCGQQRISVYPTNQPNGQESIADAVSTMPASTNVG